MSGRYAYLIAAVAAISGLLFGFDTAVINGALLFLRQDLQLSTRGTEIATTSALLFGCAAGAAFAGWLTDRLGRKRILDRLGAALRGLVRRRRRSPDPRRVRGRALRRRPRDRRRLGARPALHRRDRAEGDPRPARLAQPAGDRLRHPARVLRELGAVPRRHVELAVDVRLGGGAVDRVLRRPPLRPRVAALPRRERTRGRGPRRPHPRRRRRRGPGRARRDPRHDRPGVGHAARARSRRVCASPSGSPVFLAVFQQVTGINTVIYYGTLIFKDQVGGQSDSTAIGANVIVGLTNLAMTIVALWVIDRLGRRPLMTISSAGMAVVALRPRASVPPLAARPRSRSSR